MTILLVNKYVTYFRVKRDSGGWCETGSFLFSSLCVQLDRSPSRRTQGNICQGTARAMTNPRLRTRNSWQGEFRSVRYSFEPPILTFFKTTFKIMFRHKCTRQIRILLRCLDSLTNYFYFFKEVKLVCVCLIIKCSRVQVIASTNTDFLINY